MLNGFELAAETVLTSPICKSVLPCLYICRPCYVALTKLNAALVQCAYKLWVIMANCYISWGIIV